MKLNKREKTLLSVMGIMLLVGGYYKFVFSPQREKINNLTQQKEEYNKKMQDINKQVALKSKIETDTKVLNSKLQDMTLELFPAIKQEYLIVTIDKFLKDASLRGISLSFSDIKAVPVEQVKPEEKNDKTSSLKNTADEYNGVPVKKEETKKADNSSTNKDNKDKPSAENISININFKGSYENLMKSIKGIEAYGKKIVVSNLQISQGGTDGVTGSMQLEFYAIPKISDEDKDFFKWEFNNTYGKDNPFDGAVEGNVISSIIEDIGKTVKKENYDFVANVRSINSDLPTILIGKAKDTSRTSYLYADNPGIENIEICFTKKDDKYYYKYKTTADSYPRQYNGDGIEFKPNENEINFKIYSTKRIDSKDLSGTNIKIYNKTDKQVIVSVENDDMAKPRVSVSGEGGNIDITRN